MRGAVFRIMLLGLVRDRGALAMSFILPGVFFLIFAQIFSSASGDDLELSVAMANEAKDEVSTRLLDALARADGLVEVDAWRRLEAGDVRGLVRSGTADIGLIIRKGGEPLDSFSGVGTPPILIISDPARGATVPLLTGQVQKAYFAALPDVAFAGVVSVMEDEFLEFTTAQQARLELGIAALKQQAQQGQASVWGLRSLFEREDVAGGETRNEIAYYAGGVAVLFLLFSSVHGAITLLEEQETGVLDRVLAGPSSTSVLVDGKFLFLVVQGFVQVGLIFFIAWLGFGVPVPEHLPAWSLVTLAVSAAASGLALAVASACYTRRQAQYIANVAILILSAVGGSMVPRFLMPPLFQAAGWLTPNTWALEAYASIFWRNDPLQALVVPMIMLLATALGGLVIARHFARRLQTR
jgi:ABC-2 type transport system permease protein